MPPVYRVNGAIYINDADEITLDTSFNDNEVGFVMSAEHSVDVDDLEGLARRVGAGGGAGSLFLIAPTSWPFVRRGATNQC